MLLLACSLVALPFASGLRAQNVIDTTDAFTDDGQTKSLGSDIPFAPGDTLNISGQFTTGTLANINAAALGDVYVTGSQSFGLLGTGFNTTGALSLGMATLSTITDEVTGTVTGVNAFLTTFDGLLDLTQLGASTFGGGVNIYSGALRFSSVEQLGVGPALSNVRVTSLGSGTLAGSGTFIVAAGGNVVFDDNYARTNQLVVGGTTSGTVQAFALTIIADPGVTFGINHGNGAAWTSTNSTNVNAWSGSNGGAIVVGPKSQLVLSGTLDGEGGGFIFDSNRSVSAGGALFVSGTASATIDNATFSNNKSSATGTFNAAGANNGGAIGLNWTGTLFVADSVFTANVADASSGAASGGAISGMNNSIINVTNVLFTSNTAMRGGYGGAIYAATGGSLTVNSSTFIGNIAASGSGGAIGVECPTSSPVTVNIQNSLFQGNVAGVGGAVFVGNYVTGTIANTLFVSNTSTSGIGGALVFGNGSGGSPPNLLTLVDVSFYDNHAAIQSNGQPGGGAISFQGNNSTFNYIVSDGNTSEIAGNTYGADNTPSSFYFSSNSSRTLNFNIGQDAFLNMLDPMYFRIVGGNSGPVNKNGPGTWSWGGSSTMYPNNATNPGSISFNINAGTLHLYRAGEVSRNGIPVAAGELINSPSPTAGATNVSFTVATGATLSAGGGNRIQVSNLNLNSNSTIALDLLGITANTGTSALTLSANLLYSNWDVTIGLLNANSPLLNPHEGDVFNLITLTGGIYFTPSDLNKMYLDSGLLYDYYDLQLSGSTTLQVTYSTIPKPSTFITWSGGADGTGVSWVGDNWVLTSDLTTPSNYRRGAVVNLSDTPGVTITGTTATSATINVDPLGGTLLADMYVSGTTNYTLAGAISITVDGAAGLTAGHAGTGRLVLGALGHENGAIDTLDYSGTLTLANIWNSFNGGIEVDSGALIGNARTLGSGAAGITIANGAQVTFYQAGTDNGAYSAPLKGAGALVKDGDAPLTLTGNSATFAGTTDIRQGNLILADAAALGGNIRIHDNGATLAGTGTAGNLAILAGGALQLGAGQAGGQTFTIAGNLALDDGSIIDYSNSVTNTLRVAGAITQTGATDLLFHTITTGSFSILDAPLGAAPLDLGLLDIVYRGAVLTEGVDYTLAKQGNLLWLTFPVIPVGLNNILTWNDATADGLWHDSPNWIVVDHGKIKNFVQGDAINLAGSGRTDPDSTDPITITLATTATLTGLYLSGTESYALTGSAAIIVDPNAGFLPTYNAASASGKLILGAYAPDDMTLLTAKDNPAYAFTGTLDLSALTGGISNYASGIDIYGGALRFASNSQLGALAEGINIFGDSSLIVAAGGRAVFDGLRGTAYYSTQIIVGDATSANPAPLSLTIIAEPGALFSIQNSISGTWMTGTDAGNWSGTDGAAIAVGAGSRLVLSGTAAGPGGAFLFLDNHSYGNGGAINLGDGATALIDSATFISNRTDDLVGGDGGAIHIQQGGNVTIRDSYFVGNYAHIDTAGLILTGSNNGGAIAIEGGTAGSTLDIANTVFEANTAIYQGGAIYSGDGRANTILVDSSTFLNNAVTSATGAGGAITIASASTVLILNNAYFEGNSSAYNGGALWIQAGVSGTITDSLFIGNSAANGGGGIYWAGTATETIINTSFYGNMAGNGNQGGPAIFIAGNSSLLNYIVTTGNMARIAGNTLADGTPQGIYVSNAYTVHVNLDVEAGAILDMYDPMYLMASNNRHEHIITKLGAGDWNLGGATISRPGNNNPTVGPRSAGLDIEIAEGTLHLYRAGETFYNGIPVQAATFIASDTGKFIDDPRGYLQFNLQDGATLYAGGGNILKLTYFDLQANSKLGLDLTDALDSTTGYSVLSLDVWGHPVETPNPTPAQVLPYPDIYFDAHGWTQSITLYNIGSLMPKAGDIFNLLVLGDNAGTLPTLDKLNIFGDIPDGYHLQVDTTGKNLQLVCDYFFLTNTVLTWDGPANLMGFTPWISSGWTNLQIVTDPDTGNDTPVRMGAYFRTGDIINIAATGSTTATVINVNAADGVAVSGLYVSGTANYTLTGGQIIADAGASGTDASTIGGGGGGQLLGAAASTGKLILGAIAADDASALTPLDYTGTLTLATSAANFYGGIEINGGGLVGNDQTLGAGDAGITIAAGASLTFDQAADASYTGLLRGEGSLAKINTGALTLAADSQTFTGVTDILAGTLLLDAGASLGGAANIAGSVTVNGITTPGATFGGAGSIAGDVDVAGGSTLQVGVDQALPQNFTIGGALNLEDSFRLHYNTPSNALLVGGAINFAGTGTLDIAFYQSGTYNLGNIGYIKDNLILTVNDIIQYPDARQRAELFASDIDDQGHPAGDLLLEVIGDCSRVMYWTGSTYSMWQLTGADWDNRATAPGETPTYVFGNGDRVVFDDQVAGASGTATIARGNVIVSDMYFNGAASYTIDGDTIIAAADSILEDDTKPGTLLAGAGAGKLYVNGSGTLTFTNTSNNFTGGIDLNAGAVVFSGTNRTTTPVVNIAPAANLGFAGGVLDAATANLQAGAIMSGSGLFRFGELNYSGNVNASIDAGDILILTGNYNATGLGSIVKTGPGELRLSSTITGCLGITQVNGGLLTLTGITGNTPAATYVIPNSSFNTETEVSTSGTVFNTYSWSAYTLNPDLSITIPGGTYDVNGLPVTIPSSTIPIFDLVNVTDNVHYTDLTTSATVTGYAISFAARTYSGSAVLTNPGGSVDVSGTLIEVSPSTYAVPGIIVTFPSGTAFIAYTDTGTTFNITDNYAQFQTSGSLKISGHSKVSEVNQSFLLNGGTLALTSPGPFSEATASDWVGLTLVEGDNAPQSAISGINDIIHVGSGAVDYQLQGGLIVAMNPGDATTTFSNTANTFTGFIRVDSGTLQLTSPAVLGKVTTGMPKIALNGGALQLSASGAYNGDLQLRAPFGNTVLVDDGVVANWGNITKSTALTGTAMLLKVGSGTLVVNGANNATDMRVVEGRYVATSFSGGNNVVNATVDTGAVLELSASSNFLGGGLGQVGGVDFSITNPGSSYTAYHGSGTLLVSNGRLQLASGQTDIDTILIQGRNTAVIFGNNQDVSSYSPNGTFIVDQGSLILGTVRQILGNVVLKNNATFGFIANAGNHLSYKTANVKSLTYEGDGAGNLYFNSNLSLGRADQMIVAEPIVGDFNLTLTNYGVLPSKYYAAMELIHAPDSPDFNLTITNENSEIESGLYKYTISATTAAGGVTSVLVTGTGAMSNAASAINAVAAAIPVTWFAELDSVSQRMGDLRMEPREDAGGTSTWVRGFGDKYNYNNRVTGTPFGDRHLGAEAGFDLKANKAKNDRNLYAGAFLGYGRSDRAIAPNQSVTDSYFGGVYQTFFSTKTGIYLDTIAKFNSFKNTFTIYSPTGESATAKFNNWALGGSIEFGCNRELDYGFFVEPQAQLSGAMFSRVSYRTFSATSDSMLVDLPPGSTVNGRLGVRFGRVFDTKNSTVSAYIKLYGGGQWTTRNGLYVTLPNNGDGGANDPTRFDPYIQGIYVSAGGGLSFYFKKVNQIYLDFDTSQSSYYIKPWSFTAGIRHMW